MVRGEPLLDADRQVIAVLRVRVSPAGRLVYGEAIDADTERRWRFTTWAGLAAQMRALVAESVAETAGPSIQPAQAGMA